MSGGWVAGSVRARLLATERRLGAEQARGLAESAVASRRARRARAHAVPPSRHAASSISPRHSARSRRRRSLDLRLLAGWLPGDALGLLRALAAWYELVNIEDRVALPRGRRAATAVRARQPGGRVAARRGSRRASTSSGGCSPRSSWGDPGGSTPAELGLGLRLAWARRVAAEAPEARALGSRRRRRCSLARELFVVGHRRSIPAGRRRLALWAALADGGDVRALRRATCRPRRRGRSPGARRRDDLWRGRGALVDAASRPTRRRLCAAPQQSARASSSRPSRCSRPTPIARQRRSRSPRAACCRASRRRSMPRPDHSLALPAPNDTDRRRRARSRLRETLVERRRGGLGRARRDAARRRAERRSRRCAGSSAEARRRAAHPRLAADAPDIAELERAGERGRCWPARSSSAGARQTAVEHGSFSALVGWTPADELAAARRPAGPTRCDAWSSSNGRPGSSRRR